MRELPEAFQKFSREHPKVHQAYEALAAAAHESGPLDERTRRLVKLAISVGARLEGAVHHRPAFHGGSADLGSLGSGQGLGGRDTAGIAFAVCDGAHEKALSQARLSVLRCCPGPG
jgi:hypothetical protein